MFERSVDIVKMYKQNCSFVSRIFHKHRESYGRNGRPILSATQRLIPSVTGWIADRALGETFWFESLHDSNKNKSQKSTAIVGMGPTAVEKEFSL